MTTRRALAIRFHMSIVAATAAVGMAVGGGAASSADEPSLAECHVHQSKEVSFRERGSRDLLEMSIGTGPRYAATLAIVLRTDLGEVLYSYVERWKPHTAVNWQDPNLPDVAQQLVEDSLVDSVGNTASLPAYADIGTEMFNPSVEITESDYEALRSEGRPMLVHLTGYEMWQYVVYDPSVKAAKVIIEDGL